jgi:Ni/Co efflux regulator RcnB
MRRIASALMAGVIALGAAAPAFADPPRRHDRDWNDRRDRDWDRDHRRDRDWRDDRRNYRDGYRDGRRHDNRYYRNNWKRGDYFDRRVHYNYVVVNDYHRYRDRYGHYLGHPGRGHYYVRDNDTGEILLIAAATGLVLWALNN